MTREQLRGANRSTAFSYRRTMTVLHGRWTSVQPKLMFAMRDGVRFTKYLPRAWWMQRRVPR